MRSGKVRKWVIFFYRALQPSYVWNFGNLARTTSSPLSRFPTFPLSLLFTTLLTVLPTTAHSVLPTAKRFVLENGFTVLHVKQDQLPLIATRLVIRTGATADPPKKEGVAALTAALLKKGAGERDAVEIAETVDFRGGLLDVDYAHDGIFITGNMLGRDSNGMLELLADMVIRPTFKEDEMSRERERLMATIAQTRERAGYVTNTFFNSILFDTHPYGRPPLGTAASMSTLDRSDLIAFHQTYFTPDNAFLVIVGDFQVEALKYEIRRLFGPWTRSSTPDQTFPPPPDIIARTIHVVDKPDISQTHVRIGILGVQRNHPDYIPLLIVNTILGGGGFTSRLMDRIRVNKGLTYRIESRFTGQRGRGAFIVASFTKTETTGELIEAILEELRLLREKGTTASEIRSAKQYLSGVFPLGIEGPRALANQLSGIELFGLPDNYIATYRDRVKSISEAEIDRVIQSYIPGEIWLAVVLGKADDIIPQIEHLGAIERHDFGDLKR